MSGLQTVATLAERGATPKSLSLSVLKTPSEWQAFLLPVSGFPLPETELQPVRKFVDILCDAAAKTFQLSSELFLQVACLHVGDGPSRVASHGRKWLPMLGLGVWPDRSAPTIWTPRDFEDLMPGEAPRTVMYQVLRVTANDSETRTAARQIMLGLGTVLQIGYVENTNIIEEGRRTLLPNITDASFTCFPFYVPLLDMKAVTSSTADQLDLWACGGSLYIRESTEDRGLLIISKQRLDAMLQNIGAVVDDSAQQWTWSI